jgi:hypothetical protein
MSNPYRNALAELHAASQLYTGLNPAAADVCPAELVRRLMEAMAASAALLAQPELPELTDEEIASAAREALDSYRYSTELSYFLEEHASEHEPIMLAFRAVIAADRARPLMEQVAAMGDCIGQHTVGEIIAISGQAAAWLSGAACRV